MAKLPRKCPSCSTALEITRLTCPECKTEVIGRFQPDIFTHLSPNDFDFLMLFIKSKGNIKEMERELGISYWVVRARLNEIVDLLELDARPSQPGQAGIELQRQEILEQLNEGLLTVAEAAARLEELKATDPKR